MADQPKCLCIVARDRLRGSDFVAALGASLRPDDQLEIIVDRRSGEPSDDWDRAEDRRQRPQVDLALRANGFALVPAPSPRGERIARGERTPLSLLLPSTPSSHLAPENDYDDDEERLEAIRSFKRERSRGLARWLVAALAVAAAATFVLSPAGQTLKQSLVHRASPEAPTPPSPPPAKAPDAAPEPRGPAVSETPVAEEPSPLPSRDAGTATSTRDTRTPPVESSPPPRAATGTAARAPRPSVSEAAPSRAAAVPAPAEPRPKLISPRFAGLPRVELSREPGAASGTYAVRIVDPAGNPLADAEVLVLARMPDGTVENVRMDFSPDHGTYRGALPPTRSSPVDLRVRVITGDKRLEIPLGP